MRKTIIFWLIIVAIIATIGISYANMSKPKADDEKQQFIEKRNQIGELKYKELEAEKERDEAKRQKDELLEQLNGSGFMK